MVHLNTLQDLGEWLDTHPEAVLVEWIWLICSTELGQEWIYPQRRMYGVCKADNEMISSVRGAAFASPTPISCHKKMGKKDRRTFSQSCFSNLNHYSIIPDIFAKLWIAILWRSAHTCDQALHPITAPTVRDNVILEESRRISVVRKNAVPTFDAYSTPPSSQADYYFSPRENNRRRTCSSVQRARSWPQFLMWVSWEWYTCWHGSRLRIQRKSNPKWLTPIFSWANHLSR